MKLSQLNEFNYGDYGDDAFEASHNPDGSKKPWPHKWSELSDEEIENKSDIVELEKELERKERKLKSAKAKANKSKETQKNAITHTSIFPLQASIKIIRDQIKKLNSI